MPDRPRRRRTWPILAAAAVVLVLLVVSWVFRFIGRAVENGYAVWNVADLIIEHMEAHGDRWPSGWSDLEAACRVSHRGSNVDRTMARYRHLVEVDFSADPSVLKAATFEPDVQRRPFSVVRHRRWPEHYFSEPNVRIWSYLNGTLPRPSAEERGAATVPAAAPPGGQ